MSIGKSIRRSLILATVLVAFCIAGGSVYAADQVKIHMINVGNADSFLVEYNGHYALIDGGPRDQRREIQERQGYRR